MHNLFLPRTWSFLKFIEKYVLVFPLMWQESHFDTAFLEIKPASGQMLWSVLLTTYLASPVNIAQGTLCKAESTKAFSHMHNEHEQKTDKRAVQTPLIAVFRFKICERKWSNWIKVHVLWQEMIYVPTVSNQKTIWQLANYRARLDHVIKRWVCLICSSWSLNRSLGGKTDGFCLHKLFFSEFLLASQWQKEKNLWICSECGDKGVLEWSHNNVCI